MRDIYLEDKIIEKLQVVISLTNEGKLQTLTSLQIGSSDIRAAEYVVR